MELLSLRIEGSPPGVFRFIDPKVLNSWKADSKPFSKTDFKSKCTKPGFLWSHLLWFEQDNNSLVSQSSKPVRGCSSTTWGLLTRNNCMEHSPIISLSGEELWRATYWLLILLWSLALLLVNHLQFAFSSSYVATMDFQQEFFSGNY